MKKTLKAITGLTAIATLLVLSLQMNGCKPQENPSLYDPNWKSLPQPVVDSLSPAGSALAGIDTITIYGKNFSANKDSDGVYFNLTLISGPSIINASSNRLLVKAPTISGDTIQVRVFVIGAVGFSNTFNYGLVPAISAFSKLASGEAAYAICAGADSNLYVSLSNPNLSGTKDEGIFSVTSDGTRSAQYAFPSLAGNVYWAALAFGPNGYLYAAKGVRAVYRFAPGGTSNAQVWASATSASFSDMDFDPNHTLWVGGNNQNIYRIMPDASVKGFPFSGNVRSIRYYNGYLYFAANVGTAPSQVFRAPIVNDSLGTPQPYFDLSSDATGGTNIYAITFSSDGIMYAGTDSSDYLIVVHPGGFFERPYSPYVAKGVLNSPCKSFAWIGTNLYATTSAGQLLKIVARKQSAPYYGIQ